MKFDFEKYYIFWKIADIIVEDLEDVTSSGCHGQQIRLHKGNVKMTILYRHVEHHSILSVNKTVLDPFLGAEISQYYHEEAVREIEAL